MADIDYEAILDNILTKLQVYISDTDWKLKSNSDGVKLFCKPSREFDGVIYRSEFTVNASPESVYSFTSNLDNLKRINELLEVVDITEVIDENTKVFRTLSKSVMLGLISPRELINVVRCAKMSDSDKDYYCVYHGHVDHPKCPVLDGYVRGIPYPSGRFIFPVEGDPNKTHVIGLTQSDIKLFPQTLVEQVTPKTIVNHVKTTMKLINAGKF
ncbi:stAR-related lipid transfer protein 5-like [Glandiceps talaboti]